MTSPQVAGLAALIMSMAPNIENSMVVDIIESTTDNIDSANPSYIGLLGTGRINMYSALSVIDNVPAVPGSFTGETENNHPKITWDFNEADILHYEVWKKKDSPNFVLHTTTSNNYYVDTEEEVATGPHQANELDIYYKVKAVDVLDQKSSFTSAVNFRVEGEPQYTKDMNNLFGQLHTVESFALIANHPNPFNPTTQISYALPEACAVTMEVFDVSGRKVSVLVKKSQEQGWHYATFDGGTLPSGIYIYRINATGMESGKRFTQAKRMLLVK